MSREHRNERGMVTAELAVLAPIGVIVTVVLLWIISLGYSQIRLTDAAREAARMVARGESIAEAERVAAEQAPEGAHVSIDVDDALVTVTVSMRAGLPGQGWLDQPFARDLRATATAAAEGREPS